MLFRRHKKQVDRPETFPEEKAANGAPPSAELAVRPLEKGTQGPDTLAWPDLVQPVYLDTPAIASFFAALGEALPVEETLHTMEALARQREFSAGLKLGLPLDMLATPKLELGGARKGTSQEQAELELKSIFHHTAASPFNKLRKQLTEQGQILRIYAIASDGPKETLLSVGQLVELQGRIVRNPLEEAVYSYDRVASLCGFAGPQRSDTASTYARTLVVEAQPAWSADAEWRPHEVLRVGSGSARPGPDHARPVRQRARQPRSHALSLAAR